LFSGLYDFASHRILTAIRRTNEIL